MKTAFRQLHCSASRTIIFAVLLSTAACATGPHTPGAKWSWAAGDYVETPESAAFSRQQTRNLDTWASSRMAEIRKENPTWDKAVSDDVLVVECSEDGKVCTGR